MNVLYHLSQYVSHRKAGSEEVKALNSLGARLGEGVVALAPYRLL